MPYLFYVRPADVRQPPVLMGCFFTPFQLCWRISIALVAKSITLLIVEAEPTELSVATPTASHGCLAQLHARMFAELKKCVYILWPLETIRSIMYIRYTLHLQNSYHNVCSIFLKYCTISYVISLCL